jgi:hypothetical protein
MLSSAVLHSSSPQKEDTAWMFIEEDPCFLHQSSTPPYQGKEGTRSRILTAVLYSSSPRKRRHSMDVYR